MLVLGLNLMVLKPLNIFVQKFIKKTKSTIKSNVELSEKEKFENFYNN